MMKLLANTSYCLFIGQSVDKLFLLTHKVVYVRVLCSFDNCLLLFREQYTMNYKLFISKLLSISSGSLLIKLLPGLFSEVLLECVIL